MKKKTKKKVKIDLLGKLVRDEYLENNPNGYKSIKKIHRSKKVYDRKDKDSCGCFIFVGRL